MHSNTPNFRKMNVKYIHFVINPEGPQGPEGPPGHEH